jgi:hypothetical protein
VLSSKLHVSTGIVAMWQSGQRTPNIENRRLIAATLKPKIPIEWWDQEPESSTPARTKQTDHKRREPPLTEASSDAKLERLERLAENLEAEIETGEGVTMLERAKTLSLLTATCANIKKLRGEGIPESKVLRSERWKRVERRLLEALRPHPAALRAVGEALRELDEDG